MDDNHVDGAPSEVNAHQKISRPLFAISTGVSGSSPAPVLSPTPLSPEELSTFGSKGTQTIEVRLTGHKPCPLPPSLIFQTYRLTTRIPTSNPPRSLLPPFHNPSLPFSFSLTNTKEEVALSPPTQVKESHLFISLKDFTLLLPYLNPFVDPTQNVTRRPRPIHLKFLIWFMVLDLDP